MMIRYGVYRCSTYVKMGGVSLIVLCDLFFFFFKQKTAYEMRISDWSSDVCSSDLIFQAACERLGIEQDVELADDDQLADTREHPVHDRRRNRAEPRSEERRVGNECVRPCRSRWALFT